MNIESMKRWGDNGIVHVVVDTIITVGGYTGSHTGRMFFDRNKVDAIMFCNWKLDSENS